MKKIRDTDHTAESRIKAAARTIFYRKGYAAARTVEVAREADVSPAMLHYYFRSKALLFEVVILESLSVLMKGLEDILNDQSTGFAFKVEQLVLHYLDMMAEDPELPIFILTEMRSSASELIARQPMYDMVKNSIFWHQLEQAASMRESGGTNPIHYVLNIVGLVVFPFIAEPLFGGSRGIGKGDYDKLLQERRELIPMWIDKMLQ